MAGRIEIGGGNLNVGTAYLAEARNRLLDSLRIQQQQSSEREASQRLALQRQELGQRSMAATQGLLSDRARLAEQARQFDLGRGDKASEFDWERGFKEKAYGDTRGDTLKRLTMDQAQLDETIRRNKELGGDRDLDREVKKTGLANAALQKQLTALEAAEKADLAPLFAAQQSNPSAGPEIGAEIARIQGRYAQQRAAIHGGTPEVISGSVVGGALGKAAERETEAKAAKQRSDYMKIALQTKVNNLGDEEQRANQMGIDPTPIRRARNQALAELQMGQPRPMDNWLPSEDEGATVEADAGVAVQATAAEAARRQGAMEADRKKVEKETSVIKEVKDAAATKDPASYEKFVQEKAAEKGWSAAETEAALGMNPTIAESKKFDALILNASDPGAVIETSLADLANPAKEAEIAKKFNVPYLKQHLMELAEMVRQKKNAQRDERNRAALLEGANTGAARAASREADQEAWFDRSRQNMGKVGAATMLLNPGAAGLGLGLMATDLLKTGSPEYRQALSRQEEIRNLMQREKEAAALRSAQSRQRGMNAMVLGR